MKPFALLAALILSSCAATRPYAEAAAIGGWVGDGVTTYYRIEHDNCTEGNPIFRGVPSEGLLAMNLAVASLIYIYREEISQPVLWLSGVVKLGVTGYNATLDCHP